MDYFDVYSSNFHFFEGVLRDLQQLQLLEPSGSCRVEHILHNFYDLLLADDISRHGEYLFVAAVNPRLLNKVEFIKLLKGKTWNVEELPKVSGQKYSMIVNCFRAHCLLEAEEVYKHKPSTIKTSVHGKRFLFRSYLLCHGTSLIFLNREKEDGIIMVLYYAESKIINDRISIVLTITSRYYEIKATAKEICCSFGMLLLTTHQTNHNFLLEDIEQGNDNEFYTIPIAEEITYPVEQLQHDLLTSEEITPADASFCINTSLLPAIASCTVADTSESTYLIDGSFLSASDFENDD